MPADVYEAAEELIYAIQDGEIDSALRTFDYDVEARERFEARVGILEERLAMQRGERYLAELGRQALNLVVELVGLDQDVGVFEHFEDGYPIQVGFRKARRAHLDKFEAILKQASEIDAERLVGPQGA